MDTNTHTPTATPAPVECIDDSGEEMYLCTEQLPGCGVLVSAEETTFVVVEGQEYAVCIDCWNSVPE